MDENLMEKYLGGEEPNYEALHAPFERAMDEGHVIPVLFTDRSIYRPGQTVSYKGIVVRVDQEGDNYSTVPGQAAAEIRELVGRHQQRCARVPDDRRHLRR